MRIILTVFWLIILLIAVGFTSLNASNVTIHYYFDSISLLLPLVLFMALFLGVVLTVLALLPKMIRQAARILQLQNECRDKEAEISNLRQIPLEDKH